MDFCQRSQRYPEYLSGTEFLATIYSKMGNYKRSNELRGRALQLSDSLNRVGISKKINLLWALFEVDKALMEKEQSELKVQKLYFAGVGGSFVILLLSSFVMFLTVNNKKLKSKNRKLFEQQREQQENSNLGIMATNNIKPLLKEESPLFDRIVSYIVLSQRYTDPDISRESMAAELGTNRQYVTEAIQNNANMNFSEFINNFRLDYAQKLLLDDHDLRIKKVFLESGFNNRSAFSRLFREKYGMTPSEFKACASEERERKPLSP